MDGLRFYVPVQEVIEQAQPPAHMSADWLCDPLALGLMIFSLRVYERLRELKHAGNPGSGKQ